MTPYIYFFDNFVCMKFYASEFLKVVVMQSVTNFVSTDAQKINSINGCDGFV